MAKNIGQYESDYDYEPGSGDEAASNSEPDDDVLVLGGGGIYEPIEWKFPNKLSCPFTRCGRFGSYLEARSHFTEKHAVHSTLCVPCNKVLVAKSLQSHQLTQTHINFVKLTMASQQAVKPEPPLPLPPPPPSFAHASAPNTQMMRIAQAAAQPPKAAKAAQRAQVVRAIEMAMPTRAVQMQQPAQAARAAQMAQVARFIQLGQPGQATGAHNVRLEPPGHVVRAPQPLQQARIVQMAQPGAVGRPAMAHGLPIKIQTNNFIQAPGPSAAEVKKPIAQATEDNVMLYIQTPINRDATKMENANDTKKPYIAFIRNQTNGANSQLTITPIKKESKHSAAQHADQSKNVVQPQPRPGAPTPTKAPAAKPTPSQRPLAPDEFEIPIIDQDHRKSWRFPKTKSCPASQCGEKFVSRDQAIDHFRSVHLESAMWCADCPKLLQTPNPFKSITLHYGTMHPTVQLSPNWKQTVVKFKCVACGGLYASKQSRAVHYKTVHEAFAFKCSHTGCIYQARSNRKMQKHRLMAHSDARYESPAKPSKATPAKRSNTAAMGQSPTKPSAYRYDVYDMDRANGSHQQMAKDKRYISKSATKSPKHRIDKHHMKAMKHRANGHHEPYERDERSPKHRSHKPAKDVYRKRTEANPLVIRRTEKKYAFDMETLSRRIDSVTEIFECTNCCLEFKGETALQQHLLRKHTTSLRLQKCKLCDESIPMAKINAHYFHKHQRFIDKCPFCEQTFIDRGTFKLHITNEYIIRNQAQLNKQRERSHVTPEKQPNHAPTATRDTSERKVAPKRISFDMPTLESESEPNNMPRHEPPPKKAKRDEQTNDVAAAKVRCSPGATKTFEITKIDPSTGVMPKLADCTIRLERFSLEQMDAIVQKYVQQKQSELPQPQPQAKPKPKPKQHQRKSHNDQGDRREPQHQAATSSSTAQREAGKSQPPPQKATPTHSHPKTALPTQQQQQQQGQQHQGQQQQQQQQPQQKLKSPPSIAHTAPGQSPVTSPDRPLNGFDLFGELTDEGGEDLIDSDDHRDVDRVDDNVVEANGDGQEMVNGEDVDASVVQLNGTQEPCDVAAPEADEAPVEETDFGMSGEDDEKTGDDEENVDDEAVGETADGHEQAGEAAGQRGESDGEPDEVEAPVAADDGIIGDGTIGDCAIGESGAEPEEADERPSRANVKSGGADEKQCQSDVKSDDDNDEPTEADEKAGDEYGKAVVVVAKKVVLPIELDLSEDDYSDCESFVTVKSK